MKPKTLFILHTPPPVHGAAMVGEYIKNSDSVNQSFDIRYINLGTSKSVEDIGKGGVYKIFRYVYLLWQVTKQMIMLRPQKVYITLTAKGTGFYKDALVVLLAKMLGGDMVYHFHNKGVKTRQHKPFDNWLYKKVFRSADVILLSEHLYADVEKYVPRERVYICPNGIPDELSVKSKKDDSLKQQPVRLLFLSNLIESKGVYILLEACKILKEKGLGFECIYVGGEGDVSTSELNQRIAELDLEGKVIYVGKKYNEEKEQVFRESDIFILPTHYECFPLVLLEAMQAKLPVISTPEGGIPDVVEDGVTGFLVEQKNSEALADKLEELIKDPQKRKEMGQKGFEKYQRAFTLQAFEERFTDILKKISAHK